jgi:hypothetical protein
MKRSIVISVFLALAALSSCAMRSKDYYNHTQLVTADTIHDIFAVELINGAEVTFREHRATFSHSAQEVKGRTDEERLIIIPADQIASCVAEPPSGFKSLLGTLELVVGILGIAVLILILTMPTSHGPGW